MAAWAVPQEPLSKRLHSEPSPRRVNPILLLYRRAIEQAFLDAKECKDGEPTELAKESIQWLTAKLDWTRWRNSDGSVRIPPPEIRGELVLTFDHCCRVLEWNPDEIRAHGLPRRPSVHGNHDGLDSIFAAWGKARAVHEAKVARALEQFGRGDCLQCGASFIKMQVGQYYCSSVCRKRARSARSQYRRSAPQVVSEPQTSPDQKHAEISRHVALQRADDNSCGMGITATSRAMAPGADNAHRPFLRTIGHDVESRYRGYQGYCGFVGIDPLPEPWWRLRADFCSVCGR